MIKEICILGFYEEDAVAKLEKLAKRARKLGQSISWTIERYTEERGHVRVDGRKTSRKVAMVRFLIEGIAPVIEGYRMVAELEKLPAGVLIFGEEVGALGREWDGRCEHCGHNRDRRYGYIVENDAGRMIVGKACLRDYLGHADPAGALAVFQFFRQLDGLDGDEEGGWGYYRADMDVLEVIAIARAAIALYGWAPSSAGGESTSARVTAVLSNKPEKYALEMAKPIKTELRERADFYDDLAAKVVAWGAAMVPASDYEHNLKIALSDDYCRDRTFNLVVSASAAYDRQIARNLEREERAKVQAEQAVASEWLGEVKERLTRKVRVERLISIGDFGFGPQVIVVMKTDEAAMLSWKTSAPAWVGGKAIDVGAEFDAKFTVKAHAEFRGAKETRVSRVAFA